MAVKTSAPPTRSAPAKKPAPPKPAPPKSSPKAAAPKSQTTTTPSTSKAGPETPKVNSSSTIKDRVDVDFKGAKESGEASSSLLNGLRDNFGSSPADSAAKPDSASSVRAVNDTSSPGKESAVEANPKDPSPKEGIPISKDGRVINPERQASDEGRPGAIVADIFGAQNLDPIKHGAVDADGDGKGDISHGANTAAQLHNDGFNVTGYDLSGGPHHEGVESLVKDIKDGKLGGNGEPITMSFGNDFDMKDFGKQFGLDLKPDNIKQNRSEIRKRMEEFAAGQSGEKFQGPFSREKIQQELSMMKSIDELQKMGHPVVGAASNVVGAFSPGFLHADKLVQATDYRNRPAMAFNPTTESLDPKGGERHNLTTDIPSLYTPRAVNGPGGEFLGVSTNGDSKKAEIMPSQLSKGGDLSKIDLIRGASFATSTAIRWAEQSNEYFPNTPQLSTFPDRSGGVPRFDD